MGGTRIQTGNIEIPQDTVLGAIPGDMNFDTKFSTANIRNSFPGSSLQVGQEQYIFAKNMSGVILVEGDVVRITGYDAAIDAIEVNKALADIVATADAIGIVTTTTQINGTGLVTTFGRVNDLDTSSFSEGETIFLSSTVAGTFTATKPSDIPIQVGYIGKVDALTGFVHVDIRLQNPSIRAIFSDTTDQTYVLNVSKPINFNTEDVKEGITHSTSVNSDEITFDSAGVYLMTIEPQYTRTVGGGTDTLNMYIQKDTGSGFANIANTNIKVSISASNQKAVTSLTQTMKVNAGDKIRILIQVEDNDLRLESFVAFGTGANAVPATPSVIMNMHRVGS